MEEPITPFIHKVHIYDTYYHTRICTYRPSQGEQAHPTLHAWGTHICFNIIVFAGSHSTSERATLPTDVQDLHTFMISSYRDLWRVLWYGSVGTCRYSQGARAVIPLIHKVHKYDTYCDRRYVNINAAQEKEPIPNFIHNAHMHLILEDRYCREGEANWALG